VLEDAVSQGTYLLGDQFSAADVYVGSQIAFGMMFKMIEPRPAFQQYLQRISARPANARARDLDEALIPKAAS
jgi:glutathione S-transferase